MDEEGKSLIVTYNLDYYDVVINYLYPEGGSVLDSTCLSVAYGDVFSIEIPAITGYTCDTSVISGTMGESDLVYTVTYSAEKNDSGSSGGICSLTIVAFLLMTLSVAAIPVIRYVRL